jgi:hypothetical protein
MACGKTLPGTLADACIYPLGDAARVAASAYVGTMRLGASSPARRERRFPFPDPPSLRSHPLCCIPTLTVWRSLARFS